ncbi:hypothetical protein Q2T40_13395 [Winogradskyella maritima]|uniref:HEPN AbiU2-like domain-containing protein n=1 Tax=Winogradskyella maritima TaxID=1517766 RepID=A0ABV8AHA9_9FLAO|nr:hypothetical protein [Winogradskyella maritima]
MSKLRHVIQTLFSIDTQIKLQIETLNKVYVNKNFIDKIKHEGFFADQISFKNSLVSIISNHTIISFCSFLEEYNKFFSPSYVEDHFSRRVNYIRKKNKPGIKRINKWKDLNDFRNVIIAHNFRKKKESFFSTEFKNYDYIIPNSNSEKNLFYDIIHLICLNIRDEFPDIILTINPKFKMTDNLNIIGEDIDNKKEIEELVKLMR